ncbi:MAG TPA: glycosyltransferase family 2 protein [Capillimicrobium sp.]|nr:glycosyltransferase family 2 protein [Capillimicrobium sp.]
MTDVSVLIPVLDEGRWLRDTAAAMLAQRGAGDLELLFVDGGSTDETPAILAELAASDPRVRVLRNPARIVPAALNVGLRAARGRYVARMDAHAWYPPDYLARGIARLERGDVDWVTGPAVPRPTGRWARRVALALGSKLGQGGSAKWGAASGERELDTGVFGGIWRRELLEELGGWDESFTVNEDAEMAGRVLSRGGRIVCVDAMATGYAPRDDLRALARQYWRFGLFRVRTSHRHPVALRPAHLVSAAIAGSALAALAAPRPLRRPARAMTALYAAAVAVESARIAPRPAEATPIAAALATMHLAWGAGFLAGCARFGPPAAGIRRALSSAARRR